MFYKTYWNQDMIQFINVEEEFEKHSSSNDIQYVMAAFDSNYQE